MKRDLTLYLPVQVLGIPGTLDHHERRASQLLRAWNREVKFGEFSSVQFSCSDMSDSLRLHGLQHARLPCPLPTPGVYSNSCPLSRWCHPTISSSVVPFFSCLQSFPASGSFLIFLGKETKTRRTMDIPPAWGSWTLHVRGGYQWWERLCVCADPSAKASDRLHFCTSWPI